MGKGPISKPENILLKIRVCVLPSGQHAPEADPHSLSGRKWEQEGKGFA